MKHRFLSRRQFLQTSSLAILATAAPGALWAAQGKKIPLALQLYSVRKECAKDLPGTLNAVGRMGYEAVEFAGYHGRDAQALKQLLGDAGLKCCGTHIQLETLVGDHLEKTVEFNHLIGNQYLIVPGLPGKYTRNRETWEQVADIFSAIAQKIKPEGMTIGYHNHGAEFKPLPGGSELAWDVFFNRASKEVVIQYDIGNGAEAGADARVYLKKFPGRVASVHVKPFSKSNPDALIGQDELPWPEIFDLCENVAGVKWYIIEYERENEPPLVSVEKLHKIMCDLGKC